jgi:undecaprenyl-diphosphatase
MPEGEGLVVVVNKASGKASRGTYAEDIRAAFPKADVQEREPKDVTEALQAAGRNAPAIGVVGGDGTVNVAASIALEAGKPLAVFPGGTLDHFAQDIGISSSEDTIAAVRTGTAAAVEIGRVGERGDQIFLNTASLGGYPELVATRERLEEYLGKWPSVIIAMLRVLRHGAPLELFVDGERRRLWLLFAGNGSYAPSGFAPTYRTDLTDGWLDIRMIDADAPLGRTRLTAAVLSGRLGRSRVYEQRLAKELSLRRAGGAGDLAIALDGEVTEALPEIVMCKHPKRLLVFRPED